MTDVYVAAGSNVEPIANLRLALEFLSQRFAGLRCSTAYRNEAVGFEGEDFVNLVVGFATKRSIDEVIDSLHEAEALCGRKRDAPRWASRSMDLDILLFGDFLCDRPGLVLPRPDLTRRAYMLGPMAELAPDFVHPLEHRTIGELWADFDQAAHAMQPINLGWPSEQSGAA